MARGILRWNIWGKCQRGILEGNMNSMLHHCFPLWYMVPHSPFTDRKCQQPFRQFIDLGYWIYSSQRNKGNRAMWNITHDIFEALGIHPKQLHDSLWLTYTVVSLRAPVTTQQTGQTREKTLRNNLTEQWKHDRKHRAENFRKPP